MEGDNAGKVNMPVAQIWGFAVPFTGGGPTGASVFDPGAKVRSRAGAFQARLILRRELQKLFD